MDDDTIPDEMSPGEMKADERLERHNSEIASAMKDHLASIQRIREMGLPNEFALVHAEHAKFATLAVTLANKHRKEVI